MDEWGTPKVEPKLFIDHSCKHLIYEFNNYRAPETRSDEPANEQPGKKRPVTAKQADHLLDALRYGLQHVFTVGATKHLWETMTPTYSAEPVSTGSGLDSGYFTTGTRF
jgi:hypothetical protein